MSLGTRGKILAAAVLALVVGAGLWLWLGRDRASYESRFSEYLWIEYPPGLLLAESARDTHAIDKLLRQRKLGHLSGVRGRGDPSQIEEIELAVNLESIEVERFLEELKKDGLLPEGIKHEAGSYPRPWPDS